MARERLAENPEGKKFYETKVEMARFYFDHLMPRARTHARLVRKGSGSLMAMAQTLSPDTIFGMNLRF